MMLPPSIPLSEPHIFQTATQPEIGSSWEKGVIGLCHGHGAGLGEHTIKSLPSGSPAGVARGLCVSSCGGLSVQRPSWKMAGHSSQGRCDGKSCPRSWDEAREETWRDWETWQGNHGQKPEKGRHSYQFQKIGLT